MWGFHKNLVDYWEIHEECCKNCKIIEITLKVDSKNWNVSNQSHKTEYAMLKSNIQYTHKIIAYYFT